MATKRTLLLATACLVSIATVSFGQSALDQRIGIRFLIPLLIQVSPQQR